MGFTIEFRLYPLRNLRSSHSSPTNPPLLSCSTSSSCASENGDKTYRYEWENEKNEIVYVHHYNFLGELAEFAHLLTSKYGNKKIIDCIYQEMPFRMIYPPTPPTNTTKNKHPTHSNPPDPTQIEIELVSFLSNKRKRKPPLKKKRKLSQLVQEELIAKVMHPTRIARILEKYGWEGLDMFD